MSESYSLPILWLGPGIKHDLCDGKTVAYQPGDIIRKSDVLDAKMLESLVASGAARSYDLDRNGQIKGDVPKGELSEEQLAQEELDAEQGAASEAALLAMGNKAAGKDSTPAAPAPVADPKPSVADPKPNTPAGPKA